jgi:DNA-binding transcriptional LysR family regulator
MQETHEMQMMLGFVAAGLGVTLLPEYVKELRKPGVIWRPLAATDERIELAVAWRRGEQSSALRAYLEIVRECRQHSEH